MKLLLRMPWGLLGAAALVLAPPALAVQTDGGPRFATDTAGGVMSDAGSLFGLKAQVTGPGAERPAAFAFYPVRTIDPPGLAPGGFSLRIQDSASAARLESGRRVTFRSWGWEETAQDGALSSTARVFTVARNVFAVVLEVRGITSPLQVEARAEGTVPNGSARVVNPNGSAVARLELAPPSPGFTLAFLGTAPTVGNSSSSDPAQGTYAASLRYSLGADGTLGFLVGFTSEATPDAGDLLASLPQSAQDPGTWLGPVKARWDSELAAFAPTSETKPAWLDADRRAIATLLHGETLEAAGLPAGVLASKGQRNFFYLWDSALAALGASEGSASSRAWGYLSSIERAQRPDGDEAGLVPHHVDAAGRTPPFGVPGVSEAYSAPPLLPSVLRSLYERSPKTDEDRRQLEQGYQVAGGLLNWWTRRRDKDVDTLAEANGGIEGGADDSPRFTETWGDTGSALLPVLDTDTRARLNSVDLNAWRYLGDLELSRVGALLGKPDAADWLRRAGLLAPEAESGTTGFWDASRGGYFDFLRQSDGTRRLVQSRTPALWWPLVVGQTRDVERVKLLVQHLLDSSEFFGPYGIPSTAFNDPRFVGGTGDRGPVFPAISYFTALALYRYGYEAEAQQLRERTLDLIAAQPCVFGSYDARTGQGLGGCGQVASAGVYVELIRNRHQEEAFAVKAGGPASSREGRLRRLFRLGDGSLLFEVMMGGTYEVPLTRVSSPTQIFSDEPITFTFTDPGNLTGGRDFQVTLPVLAQATVTVTHVDGSVETVKAKAGASPIAFTARAGDRVDIPTFSLAGDRGGCSCGTAPSGPVALGVAGVMGLTWLALRRRLLAGRSGGERRSRGK